MPQDNWKTILVTGKTLLPVVRDKDLKIINLKNYINMSLV